MTSTPSKATAGPWCIPAGDGNELIVCEGDDPKNPGRILFVFRHPVGTKQHLPYEEMAANCRLSSAAPDLIEALRNFTDGRDIAYTDALVIARAALAKAEPRS